MCHAFPTTLTSAGVHEIDIMTLLGHTTLKVTRGYAHGVPKWLRDAINGLEERKRVILEGAPTSRQVSVKNLSKH